MPADLAVVVDLVDVEAGHLASSSWWSDALVAPTECIVPRRGRHVALDAAVQVPVEEEPARDVFSSARSIAASSQALEVALHGRDRVVRAGDACSDDGRAPGHLGVREDARERVELRASELAGGDERQRAGRRSRAPMIATGPRSCTNGKAAPPDRRRASSGRSLVRYSPKYCSKRRERERAARVEVVVARDDGHVATGRGRARRRRRWRTSSNSGSRARFVRSPVMTTWSTFAARDLARDGAHVGAGGGCGRASGGGSPSR